MMLRVMDFWLIMVMMVLTAYLGNAFASDYTDAIVNDGPIAYWRFQDDSSSSVALDEMGNYNGMYYNVPHGSDVQGSNFPGFGPNNYAASFDGGDDHYIDGTILGNLGSDMANGFTWEAWVKTTSTNQGAFFGMENVDGGSFMLLYMDHTGQGGDNWANYTRMHFRDNSWWPDDKHIQQSHYGVHNDGQWHHLALCVDPVAGTAKAYFDGVESAPGINLNDPFTSYANFLTGLALGARARNGSLNGVIDEWTGLMDEVAIYNKVLTPTQVNAHYVAASPFKCGDFGYMLGDINKDCYVDICDIAMLVQAWLGCIDPDNVYCW